jgi:hypothetical protein
MAQKKNLEDMQRLITQLTQSFTLVDTQNQGQEQRGKHREAMHILTEPVSRTRGGKCQLSLRRKI